MYNYSTLHITSPDYPFLLGQVNDPPSFLYVRGTLPDLFYSVAIVGSRKHTEEGRRITHEVATACAQADIPVVSGLAYGIDAIAHRAVLEAGGITVAVLPCDISTIYPKGHRQLAEEIIDNGGAVISEMPIPSYPQRQDFLIRNRIIATLATMTIVTEAGIPSGALNTAKHASDYQRPIMAVPGSIYNPCAAGTNRLIEQGAGIILSPADVLREFGITEKGTKQARLDSDVQQILRAIPKRGITINQLANQLQLDINGISSKVILLEINGLISKVGENTYRRLV